MIHTLLYRGRLAKNFHGFRATNATYIRVNDDSAPVPTKSEAVDGLSFAYMEKAQAQFVVAVEHVTLLVPVLISKERHTDNKGFGPQASLISDQAALNILADSIRINPTQGEELLQVVWSRR